MWTPEQFREYSRKRYWADPDAARKSAREYCTQNPEKRKDTVRRYEATHRPQLNAKARRWTADHPGYYARLFRAQALRAKYGLTIEQYEQMLTAQGGGCAICGVVPNGRALGVDHDHRSGAVRGILCTRCNNRLAALDDMVWMAQARAYLSQPAKE